MLPERKEKYVLKEVENGSLNSLKMHLLNVYMA